MRLILDESLKVVDADFIVSLSAEKEMIGQPAWMIASEADHDRIKSGLSVCLVLGEPVTFRILSHGDYGPRLFIALAKRLEIKYSQFLVIDAELVSKNVEELKPQDLKFLSYLRTCNGSQKEIGKKMGLNQPAVSTRERRLRKKLECGTREELLRVARALQWEREHTTPAE